jgi:cytochrome c peroxidase
LPEPGLVGVDRAEVRWAIDKKPSVEREHMAVLNERYDLSNRPAAGVTMDRTKPVQEGVRVKLTAGTTWDSLAGMTPEQIRDRNLFPPGFLPLPHPKHVEGGMVFPRFLINEIKRQEARDLTRFDVDFDIPDHFLPEFPPVLLVTTNRREVPTTVIAAVTRSPHRRERAGRDREPLNSSCNRSIAHNGGRRRPRRQSRIVLTAGRPPSSSSMSAPPVDCGVQC